MKHFNNFCVLLIWASLLSGCLNPLPKAIRTERANIPATSTPAATTNLTLTPTLPSATPTLEATPTPPPLPTLPPSKNPSSYQLTKPTPEGLLALMDVLNTQYSYFGHFYDDKGNLIFDSMLDELSNVFYVTTTETNFYYPDGFPDPQIVWDYYPFTNQDHYPVFPSVYLDSLTNAVFDDFNRHPDLLKDRGVLDGKGHTVQIYQIELDHDPQPEWLVRMDWEEIVALSWLVLDQNLDGSYTKLPRSLPDSEWLVLSGVTIETLQDFTGDGLTDIISVKQGYAAGTDWYRFYIAKGTKNGFQELDSIDHAVSVTNSAVEPHYIIETPSGSNWLTLTIVDPHRINWDCRWDTQTSYHWPYGSKQITIIGKEIPRTPDCSLAHAVSLLDPVDNTRAIELLESAIDHFDQNNIDQQGKLLFAHYRLAILYALSDQDSLSRQRLEWLVEHLTESEEDLKENLVPLLGEEKINAIKLCDSLYSAVAEVPSSWEKYMGATAAVHAYPGSTEIYPPAICPLQDIIMDQLHKVDLTVQPVTEKALTDQMIPFALIQTYPFPNQPHPASFILIHEKAPYIAGYVPALDGWRWRILEEFDATEDPPQTFFQDVTGDGFSELAYFQKYKYWYCPENEQGYKVFLTTSAGTGFVSITHNLCNPIDKTLDLAMHLPDENEDGVVDWVAGQVRQYAGDSILTSERVSLGTWFTPSEINLLLPEESTNGEKIDVIDKLYEIDEVPSIRQKLISERNDLNPTDPFADLERQRLTYFIAVSYEIQGQIDRAIEEFTSILQSENQTLWGNLAALHLTSK
jgi:hypothetical protein